MLLFKKTRVNTALFYRYINVSNWSEQLETSLQGPCFTYFLISHWRSCSSHLHFNNSFPGDFLWPFLLHFSHTIIPEDNYCHWFIVVFGLDFLPVA